MTCSLLPGLALRDATLRAAPQVSELVDLRWEQVDFGFQIGPIFAGLAIGPAQLTEIVKHDIDGFIMAVWHNRRVQLRRIRNSHASNWPDLSTKPANVRAKK